ncbi:MAG TPA: acyltransferase [Edaphobacter sp.]|jgi:peptidoglycan/LPS O-acetylase OafA/YrhL|nr:acyltransferase [Edaphobacter sp.]
MQNIKEVGPEDRAVADARSVDSRLPRLGHLPELDGIRGIAALLVFFHHLCFTGVPVAEWNSSLIHGLATAASFGDSGVNVFFVLSGFLITSLIIRDRESPDFYRDFYWKRALRILPLYAFCTIGLLIFIPGSGRFVLLCLFFIANFANVFHVSSIGPFWTLAIEEQFYLLWPTIVRRRSVASLRHWALGIVIAVIALRYLFACFGHFNYRHTYLQCDGLALGALLACMLERSQRVGKGLASHRAVLYNLLAGGIIMIAISAFIPEDLAHIAFHAATEVSGITLLCGGLVGLSIAYSGHRSLALLRSHVLTFFGLISYALYMFHTFVRDAYDHYIPLRANDLAAYFVRLVVVFAITIVLTLISRYALELPVMSLRKYVLHRPTKPAISEPL